MLCARGKKRKSIDIEDDQENLLIMSNGDYVCMQRQHAGNKRRLLVEKNPPREKIPLREKNPLREPLLKDDLGLHCDEVYEEFKDKRGPGKGILKSRGQIQLSIFANHGLLTVHVIQASHLSTPNSREGCSAYVKVRLSPDHSKRSRCKTEVAKRSCNPFFDEKFSFELLDEDLRKRILISVWHRKPGEEHGELLGCMSFGVQHIWSYKKTVNGWYYLLTEDVGKRKHLQVATRSRYTSPNHDVRSHSRHRLPSPTHEIKHHRSPASRPSRTISPERRHLDRHDSSTPRFHHQVSPVHVSRHDRSQDGLVSPIYPVFDSPESERYCDEFLPCSPVTPGMTPIPGVPHHGTIFNSSSSCMPSPMRPSSLRRSASSRCDRPSTPGREAPSLCHSTEVKVDTEPVYAEVTSTPSSLHQDIFSLEPHVFVIKRGDYGFGFSIMGSCPVRVSRIDPGTPADSVGLQRDDLIVRLNGNNMANATAESVARVIKSSERKIIMEVERPTRTLPPGQEDTPTFSESHSLVNTPEYTPLIFHKKTVSRGRLRDASPIGKEKKGLKSIGICAALPMRKVRFHDEVT